MRRTSVVAASVALVMSAAACGESPAAPRTSSRPVSDGPSLLRSPDDDTGGGGGGGGEVPGGGTPTTPTYRIGTQLYYDGISSVPPRIGYHIFKAYTQYERNVNGSWQRVDASHIAISCSINGAPRDSDSENNASKVDLTFSAGSAASYGAPNVIVTCQHSATGSGGAFTATTTWTRPAQ